MRVICIGDIHIYVSDFDRAIRFWVEGLQLEVAERETTDASAFARLDFPDGGPSVRLIGPVEPWEPGARPAVGDRPSIRFDVMTTEFDDALARLLDAGGAQEGEIESYNDLRIVTVADPDGNTFELLEIPVEEVE
jgi:catechol 2,3-dioxygenase-like lactoylglutathione lyase family enzyme